MIDSKQHYPAGTALLSCGWAGWHIRMLFCYGVSDCYLRLVMLSS